MAGSNLCPPIYVPGIRIVLGCEIVGNSTSGDVQKPRRRRLCKVVLFAGEACKGASLAVAGEGLLSGREEGAHTGHGRQAPGRLLGGLAAADRRGPDGRNESLFANRPSRGSRVPGQSSPSLSLPVASAPRVTGGSPWSVRVTSFSQTLGRNLPPSPSSLLLPC